MESPVMTPALPASAPPPNWVESNHPLGWLINRLLAVEPLRQLLFWQARRLILRTAEGRGIAWRQRREALQSAAEPLLAASTDPAVVTPAYYRARFHAYDQGNLCWAAACEAEQATDSMALRVWPGEPDLDPAAAQKRLRSAIFAAIEPSLSGPVGRVLDLGCSVGVGTLALRDWLLERQGLAAVEGLDLSPEMLVVARLREAELAAPPAPPITWHHAAAEATGLPTGTYDLITLQFVCHELPQQATRAVLAEAARLLRPGGVIAVVDQDPDSEVIRRLPAPIATLLKSTEPYLEDYFRLDFPAALLAAGFHSVRREAADPRHRVLVASR
ncbi:MAG: class I SAM-dependent methyltransferase [Cyanobacteriota bacterium]